ncbi:DUF4402 domain-containing protein [Pseudoalteromonas sp. JBTF-M23]|uniref:DUF4402 domain-containing protein n=1 Tax=Pseudoalteromonas caenipelagi TaxID=2726988 RepID=A0A849VGA3_9GAMM|nr:DUF4402 domain-containing protein [Pseudoalteromonas caenipelagi]NOU50747.1 DUF4402 domain-containing protein [Pseudoalteromonas caenipelagi]
MKWLLLSIMMIGSITCSAQVIESLNFGSLVIPRNDQVASVTIHPDNSIDMNGLYVFAPGNPALLVIESLSPGSQVFISDSANGVRLTSGTNNQYLVIEKLHYRKSHIVNQHGEVELSIGATLKTSANGAPYFDGHYSSIIEISLDY